MTQGSSAHFTKREWREHVYETGFTLFVEEKLESGDLRGWRGLKGGLKGDLKEAWRVLRFFSYRMPYAAVGRLCWRYHQLREHRLYTEWDVPTPVSKQKLKGFHSTDSYPAKIIFLFWRKALREAWKGLGEGSLPKFQVAINFYFCHCAKVR